VSQSNIRRLTVGSLGLGTAAIAAYLNTHGQDAYFLWMGVLFCFLTVLS